MIPAAHVDHHLPGRVRLRIPDHRGDARYFSDLVGNLQALEGVSEVVANPQTGGVLIRHPGLGLQALGERAQEAGWFQLSDPAERHPGALVQVRQRLEALSDGVGGFTRGEVDGRALLFLVLIALAGRQLLKGQVVAPTVTLLWYAGQLLRERDG
jgi:hypothetical protein